MDYDPHRASFRAAHDAGEKTAVKLIDSSHTFSPRYIAMAVVQDAMMAFCEAEKGIASAFVCPQCGDPTEALHEGYCEPCRDANQNALDLHNAEYDRWQGMTDRQRADEIKCASS